MDANSLIDNVRKNINIVMDLMQNAASKSGRKLSEIKLVAVSKTQPVEKIKAAIESGLTIFGENYPEESESKVLALQNEHPHIEWHMIGHLQSRKVDLVCRYFTLLHSLDSQHLAEKLNQLLTAYGKKLPVLLEVNVGGEVSKSGWMAEETQKWEMLLAEFEKILTFDHLEIKGLMVMPPWGGGKENSRPYFIKLRQLQEFLRKKLPTATWEELSMGTSFDFDVAIEEGATLVRVGEAIFGKRTNHSNRV